MSTYTTTFCPTCGQQIANKIVIHYQKTTTFLDGGDGTNRIVVKNIEVVETVTVDKLVKSILQSPEIDIKNGMDIVELQEILIDIFGIAENSLSDIIEVIKSELGLYCPDNEHLKFVETSNT